MFKVDSAWFDESSSGEDARELMLGILCRVIVEEKLEKAPGLFANAEEFVSLMHRALRCSESDSWRVKSFLLLQQIWADDDLVSFQKSLMRCHRETSSLIATYLILVSSNSALNEVVSGLLMIVANEPSAHLFIMVSELRESLFSLLAKTALCAELSFRLRLVQIITALAMDLMKHLQRMASPRGGGAKSKLTRQQLFELALCADKLDCDALWNPLSIIALGNGLEKATDVEMGWLTTCFGTISSIATVSTTVIMGTYDKGAVSDPKSPLPAEPPIRRRHSLGRVSEALIALERQLRDAKRGEDVLENHEDVIFAVLKLTLTNQQVHREDAAALATPAFAQLIFSIGMRYASESNRNAAMTDERIRQTAEHLGLVASVNPRSVLQFTVNPVAQNDFNRRLLSPLLNMPHTATMPDSIREVLNATVRLYEASLQMNQEVAFCEEMVPGFESCFRCFDSDADRAFLWRVFDCVARTFSKKENKLRFYTVGIRAAWIRAVQSDDSSLTELAMSALNNLVSPLGGIVSNIAIFDDKTFIDLLVKVVESMMDQRAMTFALLAHSLAEAGFVRNLLNDGTRRILSWLSVHSSMRAYGMSTVGFILKHAAESEKKPYVTEDLRAALVEMAMMTPDKQSIRISLFGFLLPMYADTNSKIAEFYCSESVRVAVWEMAEHTSTSSESEKCQAAACVNGVMSVAHRLGVSFITDKVRDVMFGYFNFSAKSSEVFTLTMLQTYNTMVSADEPSRRKFLQPSMRDHLVSYINGSVTSNEKIRLEALRIVCALAIGNPDRRKFFDTIALRGALISLGRAAEEVATIECVCLALCKLLDQDSAKWMGEHAGDLMPEMGAKISVDRDPAVGTTFLEALAFITKDPSNISPYISNAMVSVLTRFKDPRFFSLLITLCERLCEFPKLNVTQLPAFTDLFQLALGKPASVDDIFAVFKFIQSCARREFFSRESSFTSKMMIALHKFIVVAWEKTVEPQQLDSFRFIFWVFLGNILATWQEPVLKAFLALRKSWTSADDPFWTLPHGAQRRVSVAMCTVQRIVMQLADCPIPSVYRVALPPEKKDPPPAVAPITILSSELLTGPVSVGVQPPLRAIQSSSARQKHWAAVEKQMDERVLITAKQILGIKANDTEAIVVSVHATRPYVMQSLPE